jgi:hypothetical protein
MLKALVKPLLRRLGYVVVRADRLPVVSASTQLSTQVVRLVATASQSGVRAINECSSGFGRIELLA